LKKVIPKGLELAKQESTLIFISKDQTRVKQVRISRNKLIIYSIAILTLLAVSGKYGIDLLIDFRYDSKIDFLQRTNTFLESQLSAMGERITQLNDQVATIEKKDDEIRMIMGINELAEDVRDVGIGGSDFDYKLQDNILDVQTADDLNSHLVQLDKLDREVKLELESFNELISTYYAKEDSIRHMPAMHPVLEGRITSDYGMRLHPIFKRYRKHPGVDFAAKTGTPIYAAADGVIKLARYNGGYGNCVFIDHQYGFETRYGHMQKILVRSGQRVKRGEKIGLVGKSGIATAPHLHFEVHYNGKEVNPRHYFFDDASLNRLAVEENRQ
jgi:murein DD-endopeptidase MepM/ murein hydrolase activator NlpD